MRIVFVSYNYSPDIHSPQQWVERIRFYVGWLECLAKEHTVIRVDQINYTGNHTYNGVQYHFVDAGKKKNYFPRKLNHLVKSLQPDVVLVSSFLFPLQLIQLCNCLEKNVKMIVQHHAERPFTGIKKILQRNAAKRIDAFLFASEEIGKEWVKKGNLDKENKIQELMEVSSVFYPIEKNTAIKKTDITGNPVFLWIGRLNQNKDPLTAVKAFIKFAGNHPSARLYMIYHTDELLPEINKLLSGEGETSPVIMVGKIPHADLLYWFNSAGYFLSASYYEGSGTALCEAMSCGCIPVISDIPSFRMIRGDSGLLFEPGNETALLETLEQALQLNGEENRNKALLHFKNKLSFEAIACRFQEIVASL
jgi:glycosyltransferase involved in cell wall biosynthesis